MWSKPPEPSTVSKIGVWKLRALGIFYLTVSILLILPIVIPNVNLSIPLIVAVMALIANFVLGIVWAHQTRNQKASREKLQ